MSTSSTTTRTEHTDTDTDLDPLGGFLDGHRLWRDRLDTSLVRHGVRLTSGPPARRPGNTAGTYPSPTAAPASPHWLLDRSQEAQPYPDKRRMTMAMCRACLVRHVDAHDAQETIELVRQHPKLIFLCADCRDLALEVGNLAASRDSVDLPHTLEAFFRYVLPIDGPGISSGANSAPTASTDTPVRHPITFTPKGEVTQ